MQDHLRYAALASTMSDDELVEAHSAIVDPENLSPEQQAIVDELVRRNFNATSAERLRP